MKTFIQIREELNKINEAEESTTPLFLETIVEKTTSLKVNRNQIGRSADELGGSGSLGHGAHDLMHPDDESGASAYGHVDKKTKKFKAVQVKFGHSTSAQKVAKAMGHKEVGPHHKAIADYHNETNAKSMGQKAGAPANESTIYEAAIHSKDGTTVHHSDEDRAENYTIKHNGKTHSVSTGPHLFKKSPGLADNDIAGHVKKHISQQAPNIPSHAKSAIVNHMKNMY
jgi:hypothetical protein